MKALLIYALMLLLACYGIGAAFKENTNRRPKRRDEIEAAIDRAVSLNTSFECAPCVMT
ncbi:hypothetical protein GCM10011348_46250 [Marinobacterium nitratireducens]|uniref:Uncharacterized protein n=1 Tax=Marinobacterium nitratireducens TaxID=518897 RepID=A0A917ZS73_9GAMM|nr:hypothetical protein [Marinobacterium nitratireducens]GGO89157.1 hypothetical protein GCM10011348_46250 [Marinobacterium nitratireducens]